MTVWQQADKYGVPRIVYVNKMDKPGADLDASVASLRRRLDAVPLVVQLPIGRGDAFHGVVDLVTLEKLTWRTEGGEKRLRRVALDPAADPDLHAEAVAGRVALVEQLADVDDAIAELYLADAAPVSPAELQRALRRATLAQRGVPVVCGSSYRNVGVQPLLDAAVRYLPDPTQREHAFVGHYAGQLCALAFKTLHDRQRGPLTLVRLYSGRLATADSLYNVNRAVGEKATRLLQVSADEFRDVAFATAGDIVAVAGLKQVPLRRRRRRRRVRANLLAARRSPAFVKAKINTRFKCFCILSFIY